MSIYKKGQDYYIDYYAAGRRKREKVGTSKELAKTVLAKRRVQLAEGKFLDVRKQEKIKLEDFATTFINLHSKPNKKSWKSDEFNLKTILLFFKNKYLHDITAQDVEEYKAARSNDVFGDNKKIQPATVNRELATIKTMFAKAIAWGKLQNNPAKSVQFLREPEGRLRFLEKEEIVKLLAACSEKIKPVVVVALNTGMRRGEILGLKWHDCDFQREVISIFDTKNGEARKIPMNAQVKTALIRVRKNPNSPYVFCDNDGKPYHDLRKSFFTALKKSDIINFHFHDLRHTFASQLVMSGVDLNTIRELMGHKDIRMTLRYSHLSPDHKKRAVDVLGRQMDTIWTPKRILEVKENTPNLQHIESDAVR